ncbi:hypothetical protein [Phaeospirillum tilakii]|uniref:Uncharacterized protein n=1 Tax=Phaeospirillum tilakii TaxID=741673 RepID=A0ABW5C932_9PROT
MSFSVLGASRSTPRAERISIDCQGEHYVLVRQRRKTADNAIPFFQNDGSLLFLLIASTKGGAKGKAPREDGEAEFLCGKVFVYQRSITTNKPRVFRVLGREIKIPLIKEKIKSFPYVQDVWNKNAVKINEITENCLKKSIPPRGCHCPFDVNYNETIQKLAGNESSGCLPVAVADITISRSGTTDINFNISLSERENVPKFESEDLKGKYIRIISAQIFFFIKDVSHNHQHHHHGTDTMSDIYPVENDEQSEIGWRQSVLYNMYRAVIESKRGGEFINYYDCIGIISYAKTFRIICQRELTPADMKCIPEYNEKELCQSLAASAERKKGIFSCNKDAKTNAAALTIAISALILSWLSTLRNSKWLSDQALPEYVMAIANYWIKEPTISMIITVSSALAIAKAINKTNQVYESKADVLLLRILQSLPKKAAVIFLLLLFTISSTTTLAALSVVLIGWNEAISSLQAILIGFHP